LIWIFFVWFLRMVVNEWNVAVFKDVVIRSIINAVRNDFVLWHISFVLVSN